MRRWIHFTISVAIILVAAIVSAQNTPTPNRPSNSGQPNNSGLASPNNPRPAAQSQPSPAQQAPGNPGGGRAGAAAQPAENIAQPQRTTRPPVDPPRQPPPAENVRDVPDRANQNANPNADPNQPSNHHRDAVEDVQNPRNTVAERPEQKLTERDQAERFRAKAAPAVSSALEAQPSEGRMLGFDFAIDPLNADRPGQSPAEIKEKETAARPEVMAAQRKLLEQRYDLQPRFDPQVTMSRGKPVPVGPTARLAKDMSFAKLAELSPQQIREQNVFPYPALPHPLHANGGQVFPKMQIDQFPRLQRFDVEFDLPDAFIPEFPPAVFLQNRPELGDVSRGEVISINNFHRLLGEILTPVQLEGMRLLLTPMPQEEFNATDDRKTAQPSLGVACLDCHVNGHTTAQFHLSPDIRPQHRRFRLDTTSLRGLYSQQIHGSKRSLRSVEDFTEFEQRTAYFNGDPIHAMKKGFQELPRSVIPHMAQVQNMFDFPPAPKLTVFGRLDPSQATESELRGEKVFFGKGQCAVCHPAPFYLTSRCMTCIWNGSSVMSRAMDQSRASLCVGLKIARLTCMTDAA